MDIFNQDFTKETFNQFMLQKINSKNIIQNAIPMRIFNTAKEQHITEEFEKKVISKMYEPDRRKVQRVIKLDDDLAIIESFESTCDGEEEKNWYRIYYNGHVDSTVTSNLDVSIIMAICLKHNCEVAGTWICRMLEIGGDNI